MESGMTALATPDFARQTPFSGALRSLSLPGRAGCLEALVNESTPAAQYAALVCHPHPRFGGNLHNKVVYHAMKALNDLAWGLGWPVMRFNFRGTGRSEGVHDGEAEVEDVLTALDWLREVYGKPLIVVGFSFGAAMAAKACCTNKIADLRALALLGLPTKTAGNQYSYPFLTESTFPKLFLSGDRDVFAPPEELKATVAQAAEPKRLVLLTGADHFFTGQLERMQSALAEWLTAALAKEYAQ
jgi:alpha/beta superfamily hydrolase